MTVVLLSSDLAVLSRVEGAAARLGEKVRQATAGPQAVDCCEQECAGLLIVDLSSPALEIESIVSQLKAKPAIKTRVVAFGPHVHEERLAAAQSAGCDLVMTRGQFDAQMQPVLARFLGPVQMSG